MRAALRQRIERHEGREPSAYQDSKGYWTIGIGHMVDERIGGRLPDVIIDALLNYDLDTIDAELDQHIPWWRSLSDNVQECVAELCFQLGWPKLHGFQKMLTALEAKDYKTAAAELLDSDLARHDAPARTKETAERMAGG